MAARERSESDAGLSRDAVLAVRHPRDIEFSAHYEVGDELGRGSFAVVRQATHKETGKKFAVKIIEKKSLIGRKMEMVEAEIAILSRLNHNNIIQLYEIFESEHQFYLVMELIFGGELFDKIVELHFYSEKDASRIVAQLASAIDHLHSKSVVHRDLKPENLLLESDDPSSPIKLADFGLSKILNKSKPLKQAVGTPGYIAPEILRTLDDPFAVYGKEVDLWSLGVILYILLCGFPPFYAENDDDAFDQILSGEYPYPKPYWDNISDDAKDLIDHLLVLDVTKRYTAADVLKHRWVTGSAPTTHLGAAIEQIKKFNARRKWKGAILATVALSRFTGSNGFLDKIKAQQAREEAEEAAAADKS